MCKLTSSLQCSRAQGQMGAWHTVEAGASHRSRHARTSSIMSTAPGTAPSPSSPSSGLKSSGFTWLPGWLGCDKGREERHVRPCRNGRECSSSLVANACLDRSNAMNMLKHDPTHVCGHVGKTPNPSAGRHGNHTGSHWRGHAGLLAWHGIGVRLRKSPQRSCM